MNNEVYTMPKASIITKQKYDQLVKMYKKSTDIDVSLKSREKNTALARQCLFFILRTKYGMKTTTLGWMANKNHATIIHSVKNVKMFLQMKDALTINLMDEWVKVFKALFGSNKNKMIEFEERLDELINFSGLSFETINNLLASRMVEHDE